MLDFLGGGNQRRVQYRAFFDLVDDFLAFFDQAFHGSALHAVQPDLRRFDNLVYAFDLTLGFLQMSAESIGELASKPYAHPILGQTL